MMTQDEIDAKIKNAREKRELAKPLQSTKKDLDIMLSHRDAADLRFMYFDAPHGYKITIVSEFQRDSNLIVYAFSFCSPKNMFSKINGKIFCIERLDYYKSVNSDPLFLENSKENIEFDYIVVLPFANLPKIIGAAMAYNMVKKPTRLAGSTFKFEGDMYIE